jgi:hypothetical protein
MPPIGVPPQGVVKHGRWNALIFAWSMCDARETGACAEIAGFLKMKRTKNKKQKYLRAIKKYNLLR